MEPTDTNTNGTAAARPGVACAPLEVVGDQNMVSLGRGIGVNRDFMCFAAGVGFTLLTIWLIGKCNDR